MEDKKKRINIQKLEITYFLTKSDYFSQRVFLGATQGKGRAQLIKLIKLIYLG